MEVALALARLEAVLHCEQDHLGRCKADENNAAKVVLGQGRVQGDARQGERTMQQRVGCTPCRGEQQGPRIGNLRRTQTQGMAPKPQ